MPRLVGSMPVLFVAVCLHGLAGSSESAFAQQPGWSPVIVPTGEYRQQIKSLPIEQRPYRPLHFYGNSVRRNYYRGTASAQLPQRQAGRAMVNQTLQGGVVLNSMPPTRSYRRPPTQSFSGATYHSAYPTYSSGYSGSVYRSARPVTTPIYSAPAYTPVVPVRPALPILRW